jgi:hypothetical protein
LCQQPHGADDEEIVIGHRIEFSSDSLNVGVDVDDNGRIAIAAIAGGGTSLQARHHVAALELQSVAAPHQMPVQRLAGSTGAVRLRYREHATGRRPPGSRALAAAHQSRIGGPDQHGGSDQYRRG